ncbi:hypothetical protein NPIL_414021 [Nephila pilipes]|uniref:Uncharacterized protein n=1 Tax=Nephila pilipes TaxID=299642 RepID=A0A8X6PDC0_NEPPI|nr:hypothetical protein NPIL_414021 [Nephila pilipes]
MLKECRILKHIDLSTAFGILDIKRNIVRLGAKPLVPWVWNGHQKVREIIDIGSQISVIREVQYEENGYNEIVSAFGEKEIAPLRIFEMSNDDGAHGAVCGIEETGDEDVHIPSEMEMEYFSLRSEALAELSSIEPGEENVTQRYRDRFKGKRNVVNADYRNEALIRSAAGYLIMLNLDWILRNEYVKSLNS